MAVHQLLVQHRNPLRQHHEPSSCRRFGASLLRPGVAPPRRRPLATVCVMPRWKFWKRKAAIGWAGEAQVIPPLRNFNG